jgi:MmyB-like transcription regulator ligand binding domain
LRLSLHPRGLAPAILNLREWSQHLLGRLRREIELTADAKLEALLQEAEDYGLPRAGRMGEATLRPAVAIPLRLASRLGELSFLSTVTVFGTPIDVTLSEIALELLYAADAETAAAVRKRDRPKVARSSRRARGAARG